MTKKVLKGFHKSLIEERNELTAKLNADKEKYGDLSKQDVGDIVDKANYMWELNRTIDMTETDKELYRQIEAALNRIETGRYGICSCGNEIEIKRLEALPWTTLCVSCVKEKQH